MTEMHGFVFERLDNGWIHVQVRVGLPGKHAAATFSPKEWQKIVQEMGGEPARAALAPT